MKSSSLIFIGISFVVSSCNPRNLGPVGDVFHEELYWKLNAFAVKGNLKPVEQADGFAFLSFTTGNKDVAGHELETFNFFDSNLNPTTYQDVKTISWDVNGQERTIGTYIKKTESGLKFFKATVYFVPKNAKVTRLELSNLMDYKYDEKNDTIRYTYSPVAKF